MVFEASTESLSTAGAKKTGSSLSSDYVIFFSFVKRE
jgi:hypothetical protein